MKSRRSSAAFVLTVQALVLTAIAASLAGTPGRTNGWLRRTLTGKNEPAALPVSRVSPIRVEPLYDDPSVVSDEDLAAVLRKIRPKFSHKRLKPNFVEHALRTWGVDATFRERGVMSGVELRDVLVDHGRYVKSWSAEVDPLLIGHSDGISVRCGRSKGASVHHDHLLASLTEAGVRLDTRVYPPSGSPVSFNDLLQKALRDFRLDEREVEWSAMAFGLWLAPSTKSWTTSDGRKISFDRIAGRLIRGHQRFGVCSGTHRLYSLTLLLRLDRRYDILSDAVEKNVRVHLRQARDRLVVSQFPDGHWPSNWADGRNALTTPVNDPDYKKVIATGHHLEWLAIAPAELLPPRDRIRKAARWLIRNVREQSERQILKRYTFYSHVGRALALWRKTYPAEFWRNRQATHAAVCGFASSD